ncbi:energy transducer TonB [Gammaproteobacteria bacterium AB-CW1]|uniref:Energy transducer TonB n=1 Tax=Natronospira elongata TaxID=3110268 RepID=A0AAP6MJZ7_9GAMM|nr:energy transducer TonB [Gammaproteobacteria bacterium AB-CW1]
MKRTLCLLGTLIPLLAMLLVACAGPRPLFDTQETPVERYWELVELAEPVYPDEAIGQEGHVVVRARIGSDGKIASAEVLESEPGELFVEATLAALYHFRYEATEDNPDSRPLVTEFRFEFEPDD